jgi:hypothetical protein
MIISSGKIIQVRFLANKMLFTFLILLLMSNAVVNRRDKSILYSRVAIIILLSFTIILFVSVFSTFLGYISIPLLSLNYWLSFLSYLSNSDMFSASFIELVQNSDIVIFSTPIVVYSNADTLKLSVLKDNKEKTGIYQ